MKNKRIFGLQRNVFFTGLTSFFTDTSTKMIYSVMPLFLLSIGASKTSISLIEGIAESTASLIKAFSGYWSDKIGKNKPFMIFGYGITALITPLYALVRLPVQVLLLRFVERTGKGLRAAPRDSLISASVSKEETGKNFGFHKAMDNSGAIIGPLVAFLLLSLFPLNYSNIFLIATIPAILGVITIAIFIKEAKTAKNENQFKFHFNQLPKKFYFFLFIVFIFTLGNSADALLLVKTAETGINKSYVPFVYMIFNTVSVILSVPLGKISDKIGRELFIILGFLIYSIVYFFFGRFNSLNVFLFLFVLYGLYSALVDGTQKSLISDIVSEDVKGTGFGLYHAVLGITLLPASLIAGLLYDHVNSNAPFYFGSLMALIASLLMVIFVIVDRKNKSEIHTVHRIYKAPGKR
ncbi:MAG TPA: MFS transporter [Bacteroidales bacterium]|jgi:MFS family permease|nr:MFS transporter [Bacteroidales bacterium]MCZ2416270.1 MFS transporter [Burkholderiales bacterium]OQC56226.1 MAG: bicyclomycin/multidrug efflux system [Bacteroidetes bacterium ADurb.Bin013]MBP8998716.1 MFS transporter [Bacteroidales bacterium]MBV6455376.1 Multidrug resistance protein MdtG [Bacteroidales bacterium]